MIASDLAFECVFSVGSEAPVADGFVAAVGAETINPAFVAGWPAIIARIFVGIGLKNHAPADYCGGENPCQGYRVKHQSADNALAAFGRGLRRHDLGRLSGASASEDFQDQRGDNAAHDGDGQFGKERHCM